MTTLLVERDERSIPRFELHLSLQLTKQVGGLYLNPYFSSKDEGEDIDYRKELSPVGLAIMDGIEHIHGLGGVMCGVNSFDFFVPSDPDQASIIGQVIEVIQREVGDELTLSIRESESAPVRELGATEEARVAFVQLLNA